MQACTSTTNGSHLPQCARKKDSVTAYFWKGTIRIVEERRDTFTYCYYTIHSNQWSITETKTKWQTKDIMTVCLHTHKLPRGLKIWGRHTGRNITLKRQICMTKAILITVNMFMSKWVCVCVCVCVCVVNNWWGVVQENVNMIKMWWWKSYNAVCSILPFHSTELLGMSKVCLGPTYRWLGLRDSRSKAQIIKKKNQKLIGP